jgi:hypothetical protein
VISGNHGGVLDEAAVGTRVIRGDDDHLGAACNERGAIRRVLRACELDVDRLGAHRQRTHEARRHLAHDRADH